jgi:hypothetical protein
MAIERMGWLGAGRDDARMRFFWRTSATSLPTSRTWLKRLEPKNRRPGTSAPTLAVAWSGPLDVLGALRSHPEPADVAIDSATVEARSRFDVHGGNVRNHDLLLRGSCHGEPLVVCIEAKAGEPLGATVAEQAASAAKALAANPRSQATARITQLVNRLCRYPIDDARVSALRYQLLTAWAGTPAEATTAARAVFVLHEFRTAERPEDKSSSNGAELERFADVVLGCALPSTTSVPWCQRVPDVETVDATLFVAHVVSDLRLP